MTRAKLRTELRTKPAHCRAADRGELDAAMSLQLTLHANDSAALMITVSRKTIVQLLKKLKWLYRKVD